MNKKLFSKVFVLLRKIQPFDLSIFGEKGAALVTSILFATVIGLGALVATKNMTQDIELGERYTETREAFYIAEAGIQTAMNYLNYDEKGDPPGDAGVGFTKVLANFELDRSEALSGVEFGGGTYTVTVRDNDDNDDDKNTDADNTIILSSTGIKDGRNITIEAVIQNGIYRNKHAITSGGNFTIEGDPTVQGNLGSIHSNSDIVGISSNVEQGIFAAGECDQGCESGAISEEIPLVKPSDFSSYANFILTSSGSITDAEGEDVDIEVNQLENWSFSNAGWELEGCSGHGMFYSETGVRLTGSIEKCSAQEILPQPEDSCQKDTVNLMGSPENIALVKLYLSKASEIDKVESEQSLKAGLSCDDFVKRPELQSFSKSIDSSNQYNRTKGNNNRINGDSNQENQRKGKGNRAKLDNYYNAFVSNTFFQNQVRIRQAQFSFQDFTRQRSNRKQDIGQNRGLSQGQEIKLTGKRQNIEAVRRYLKQLPDIIRRQLQQRFRNGLNCDNFVQNQDVKAFLRLENNPKKPQNQEVKLTGRNENIALVNEYLRKIPKNYRNQLEQSLKGNLNCDEFVEREDFQAFMSPRYIENNENQCPNIEGINLTGRSENIRTVRRYLRQLSANTRKQLQKRFRSGIDCDEFVQNQGVQAFLQQRDSNTNSAESLSLTLLAEGDILLSGKANIQNFKNENHPEEIQNLLFVAAGDIDLDGTVSEPIDGIVTAGEQVSLIADAELSGYVIASDVYEESSLVTESKILESFTVTYNDLKNPFLNDQTKILSWKQ
jgi:hypothetical protein